MKTSFHPRRSRTTALLKPHDSSEAAISSGSTADSTIPNNEEGTSSAIVASAASAGPSLSRFGVVGGGPRRVRHGPEEVPPVLGDAHAGTPGRK